MAANQVRKFRCADCADHFTCLDKTPQRVSGATLKYGCQYCLGGKKTRVFRPRDPKVYPPAWCPKRKDPAEYRIYSYMNAAVRYCRRLFKEAGSPFTPSGYEYALRAEGSTGMAPTAFQKALKGQSPSELLGSPVYMDDVIEIDDGLRPYFFFVTDKKVEVLCRFDKDSALKNHYEGTTAP